MTTTAETVVGFLANSGVRRIYGVAGEGSSLDLIEAVRACRMHFVAVQQAEAAAIMAATGGDLTGKPGVCIANVGSGAAGAVPGVRHAYLDRLPLVLISGCQARTGERMGWRQRVENTRIFRSITKKSVTITRARAERLIAWAWAEAMGAPPGPVHLDLPADEAAGSARRRALPAGCRRRDAPSPSAIRMIARLLARSGRAVIVAGLGCRDPGAAGALRELVEHLGAPTLTTPRAKGVIPEDHPLAAGVFFGGKLEADLLNRADCVLAIGLDPDETPPLGRRFGSMLLTIAEYRNTPNAFDSEAEAVGGLIDGLAILRENLPPAGVWSLAAWSRQGVTHRNRSKNILAEACRAPGGGALAPNRVVEIAREVFPKTTLATTGTGAHALAATAFWETYEPKSFLCSANLGGVGYALPAAIAAKLEAPNRPVLAFMGDNGFLLDLPEVATATRLESPLVMVVFVDDALSLPRVAQEQKRYAPLGVALNSMDIPKIAEGLGALGTAVEDEAGLRMALTDALHTTKPAIIAARVNPRGYRRMLERIRGRVER